MMEGLSATQNHKVGTGAGGQDDQIPQYSIPGILHFIQHEWAKFEMERAQWEVEKAELQARVAFLQGERRGQENLKNGLIRRIKMLEYALKQEKVKFHKLKYGTDLNFDDPKSFLLDGINEPVGDLIIESNVSLMQGRQLLRQYLQEIGYTDTVIDVRSSRVRTLLGLASSDARNDRKQDITFILDEEKENYVPGTRKRSENISTEKALMDVEQSVLDSFGFLSSENAEDKITNEEMGDDFCKGEIVRKKAKPRDLVARVDDGMDESSNGDFINQPKGDNADLDVQDTTLLEFPPDSRRSLLCHPDNEATLGLGELASLTVNNEAEEDISSSEAFGKTWDVKYTLRSHLDGVRALAFHPIDPLLITASEDHTLKLWNLQETSSTASLDVEPVYTFRGHTGPVLSLALSTSGDQCFSGGADNTIRCWNIPSSLSDLYDSFDPSVLTNTLKGHTDAVWGLSMHSSKLLSCSADGTVCLWSPQSEVPLLLTYRSNMENDGSPTSVDFLRCDTTRMVAAYASSTSVIYDLETGKPVVRLHSNDTPDSSSLGKHINRILCHPTLPLTLTAHEDRHIRVFDNNTGQMIHSMVAHLDAVTSLAMDPNGIYLLSGSHDCSIRLWNMDTKTCVQEITSHRKKFDEAVLDVAFHPSKPYFASAGADGLAKVFV